MVKRNETLEIGCHFDGARGHYIGEAIQELAIAYGWEGPAVDANHEDYHDATTEADEYMSQFGPAGAAVGFNENGDWGVWPVCRMCGEYVEEGRDLCDDCQMRNRR